ncbi:MAG: ATP-dependent ligase [Candidatus Sulfotelmatobacter sp.]|nr:ATP-dependent ligase [Candidatus Sulfotelmatobacter sp.]
MQPELLSRILPTPGELLPGLAGAARFILADRFWAQQKWDGERLLVRRSGRQIEGWNKKGQTTAVDPALMSALLSISVHNFILDGEYEPSGYRCWDLLQAGDEDLRSWPYRDRYGVLKVFAPCPRISVLPVWRTSAEKERIVFELHSKRAEGVAFKDSLAPYRPGRAGQHYKLKFVKTATVRIRSIEDSRDSARIEMLDGLVWRDVSGIKVRQGSVKVGDFVEVRYSSASGNKCIQQPVFIRTRNDVSDQDCSVEQLEYSGRWAPLR